MARRPSNPGSWPRLMRAETAAAYVDERSVEAFRRRIGSVYPHPVNISGRGEVWLKDQLDASIANLKGETADALDAAGLL
jgi:hypothetical protein